MNRVYVEKKKSFNLEALDILNEINKYLKIASVTDVRSLLCYDVEGLSDEEFLLATTNIFSQSSTENVFSYDYNFECEGKILALEYLAGQYDQRSDFATQCVKLIASKGDVIVKCSKLLIFSGNISEVEFSTIKNYFINPVECVERSTKMKNTLKIKYAEIDTVENIDGFCKMDKNKLLDFRKSYGINMDLEDLLFCQNYFVTEKKDPTITEIRVFDTFWSDHCRHSTFLTVIDDIVIEDSKYKTAIEDALNRYYSAKKQIGNNSPVCLMDIAVMNMKKMRHEGNLDDMEVSEEVNACSIYSDVIIDDKPEKWIFSFKNETHNHPTEIEPFGGASTCLGGGIRDPLSGRAFVHGAIRLTGSGDPRVEYADTLVGKLPQRKITKTAAEGYSSYSNQIGLASGQLIEIYDKGFVAKRMECGALVAGAKKEDVVRMSPANGDVIVLLGGDTGRDGCGGATGSSREHDESSLEGGGAEVQKGNPAIERNIVRLFRDPKASRMIKKCNDFGAGGVSVAVCEIAESLKIDLDVVPLKYGGMDGTEIAISESQERMACLLSANDLETFIDLAAKENLQCVKIATVTDSKRVIMSWKGNVIVDIASEMLNSGGVRRHTKINVGKPENNKLEIIVENVSESNSTKENWLNNISDLNVCSKGEIANRFDTTAGSNTLFSPEGGKYQKTPELGLCMNFPARVGTCDTACLMSVGYNPKLGYFSPFHQGIYAVIESVSKVVAMGGDMKKAKLSFQEYYEKLGDDTIRWGKPFAALLGAYLAQDELSIPAIGGKDSMSGTYVDIDVPPSLISFAVSTVDSSKAISREFKKVGSKVIYVYTETTDEYLPDWKQLRQNLMAIQSLGQAEMLLASSTVEFGGLAASISKMCFGNRIGFTSTKQLDHDLLFAPDYTAFVLEVAENADLSGLNYIEIGITTDRQAICVNNEEISLSEIQNHWEQTLVEVFPSKPLAELPSKEVINADYIGKSYLKSGKNIKPKVIIPVFPGTNGEYELEDGFIKAGAEVIEVVFRNRSPQEQTESIENLAKAIYSADILAIPSGMSAGGEPNGSAKMISTILSNKAIKAAITNLVDQRMGLVIGIGEGFAALVKVGLLPFGKYCDDSDLKGKVAIEKNITNKYMCKMVNTRITSVKSPWLSSLEVGETFIQPLSIQEGRLAIDSEMFEGLYKNGQITSQYVDRHNKATMDTEYNPAGSCYAVESMISPDGRIIGKMVSFERVKDGIYKNIPGIKTQDLLTNAVQYFKKPVKPIVAIIMGSDSDWKHVKPTTDILNTFGVAFEVNIMSAHRTPDQVCEYAKGLYSQGFKVVIAAAGKAAHLPGVIASYTTLPVIGLPIAAETDGIGGIDALLSMVQMPPGIPVATVGINGGNNAAILAVTILSISDKELLGKLTNYRNSLAKQVAAKHSALQKKMELSYE